MKGREYIKEPKMVSLGAVNVVCARETLDSLFRRQEKQYGDMLTLNANLSGSSDNDAVHCH